jgi:hypothetical protein
VSPPWVFVKTDVAGQRRTRNGKRAIVFATAGSRQPLLVRESAAVQYVRFSVSSDKINVKTSFGRQPCNRCVSQPWVRCAHHGRFTKIFGSAWIALNWVRCAHRGRFTPTALLWRRRFARAGGPTCAACFVSHGRFTPTALLWRRRFARAGGPHALHCFVSHGRLTQVGSGAGCTPPASIAHMRTAFGRLTQVATGAGGTGG